jgi:hypothetical protein
MARTANPSTSAPPSLTCAFIRESDSQAAPFWLRVEGVGPRRGISSRAGDFAAGGTSNSTQPVDGGYNNDPQLNAGNVLPFPDALREFRTESGVRDARYGMSTGATVNAVTKSGTNTLHGNAFDFCDRFD